MFITKISFRGSTIEPIKVKDKHCYFTKNGIIADFLYRPVSYPSSYVKNGELFTDKSNTHMDEKTGSVLFDSVLYYIVKDNDLIIKES